MPAKPSALLSLIPDQIDACGDTDFVIARRTVAEIEASCASSQSHLEESNYESLAVAHYYIVKACSDCDVPTEAQANLEAIGRLHGKYPGNAQILKYYADALVYIHNAFLSGDDFDMTHAAAYRETLLALSSGQTVHDLSLEVAICHYNQIYHCLEEREIAAATSTYAQLEEHASRHPGSFSISEILLMAQSLWITAHVEQREVTLAAQWYGVLEAFIEKQANALSPSELGRATNIQVRALGHLIDALLDKAEPAAAEKYYAIQLKLVGPVERVDGFNAAYIADSAISFCNHYILAREDALAASKFETLRSLATRYPEDCSNYYARALYALCSQAIDAGQLDVAETHHATLKRLVTSLADKDSNDPLEALEPIVHLAGTSAALSHAYGNRQQMVEAQRCCDDILKQIEALEPSVPPDIIEHASVALYNLVHDYVTMADVRAARLQFERLSEFAAAYPTTASAQNHADAASRMATGYAASEDTSEGEKFLQQLTPDIVAQSPAFSMFLYNLIVRASDAKNFAEAEQRYAELKNLAQHNTGHTASALRLAKAAYNLHYDYSDSGDFARAEEKYRDLQALSNLYQTSLATENGNPIGLEVALRQANAARNYAVDLKNRALPPLRVMMLHADVSALATRWPQTAADPIRANLGQIARMLGRK